MPEMTDRQKKLPDEILASQKTRSTLLKWKLAIVASLGAAGLGLTSATSKSQIGLLSLIPFVCVYVDLLCTNINLRIILIGRYLAEKWADSYELFAKAHRKWFDLENGRAWSTTSSSSGRADATIITVGELIMDGQYRLRLNHTNRWAHFSKRSRYQQMLAEYQGRDQITELLFDDISRFGGGNTSYKRSSISIR